MTTTESQTSISPSLKSYQENRENLQLILNRPLADNVFSKDDEFLPTEAREFIFALEKVFTIEDRNTLLPEVDWSLAKPSGKVAGLLNLFVMENLTRIYEVLLSGVKMASTPEQRSPEQMRAIEFYVFNMTSHLWWDEDVALGRRLRNLVEWNKEHLTNTITSTLSYRGSMCRGISKGSISIDEAQHELYMINDLNEGYGGIAPMDLGPVYLSDEARYDSKYFWLLKEYRHRALGNMLAKRSHKRSRSLQAHDHLFCIDWESVEKAWENSVYPPELLD